MQVLPAKAKGEKKIPQELSIIESTWVIPYELNIFETRVIFHIWYK